MQHTSSIEFLLMRRIFPFANESLPDSENTSEIRSIIGVKEI